MIYCFIKNISADLYPLLLINSISIKGKVHLQNRPWTPRGVYRYSSTFSLTSALDGVGGLLHAPAALRETLYPMYRRLSGPQDRSGRVRKITPLQEFDPWTVQSVTSRYIDYVVQFIKTKRYIWLKVFMGFAAMRFNTPKIKPVSVQLLHSFCSRRNF
jgi:hypothetical protein